LLDFVRILSQSSGIAGAMAERGDP